MTNRNAGPGPKPKPPEELHSERFTFVTTPALAEKIRASAEAQGVSLCEWLRQAAGEASYNE